MTLLSPPAFKKLFDHYNYSVFRLETQQSYSSPDEEAGLHAFLRGEPPPTDDPGADEWISVLQAAARTRRTIQRVHVVTEPLSDYIRYELLWSYAPGLQHGEDVRIVALPEAKPWPADLGCGDFWLFDASRLYVVEYDQTMRWRGVRHVTDPSAVLRAARTREAALHHSIPWSTYITSQPALRRALQKAS